MLPIDINHVANLCNVSNVEKTGTNFQEIYEL